MWFQVTVETTTWNVFHHKNNIFLRINNFEETNDVKTMHFLHKFNFSFNRLSAIWVHQLVLFVNFHRHFSVWRLMQTYSDNGICPLSNLFPYYVFVQWRLIAKNHAFFVLRIHEWVVYNFNNFLWLFFFFLQPFVDNFSLGWLTNVFFLVLCDELVIRSNRCFLLLRTRLARFCRNYLNSGWNRLLFWRNNLWFTETTVICNSRPKLVVNEHSIRGLMLAWNLFIFWRSWWQRYWSKFF